MNDLSSIAGFIPFIVPLFLLQFVLLCWSIVDMFKRDSFRFGNRIMWLVICVFITTIGPILYLTIGRGVQHDE